MKKWIVIVVGALTVFMVIGIVSIYYIVGVANRATYKRQTQTLVVETFDALQLAKSGNTSQGLAAFKKLNENSEDAADKLADRPAPSGAEELKSDAVQVIDLASDIADRGILMYAYIDKVDGTIRDWSDEISSAETSGDPIAKLEKFKTATANVDGKLKGLKPPSSLVAFHLELTELLREMTSKLGEMVVAAKAGDATKLQALSDEWDKLSGRVDNLTNTVGQNVADDIISPSEKRKLDRLTKEIDNF